MKAPAEALLVQCDFLAQDAEKSDGPTPASRAFKGVANSGGIIEGHWFWGNFAVDMAGLKVPRKDVPVFLDHRFPIGFTQSVEKGDKGVNVEGMILDASQHGIETLRFMEQGMPFQMSVYVPPDRGGIEKVEEGQTAEVNGRKLKGPGHIFRKSTLREVTITALGADQKTSAALLSGRGVNMVEVGDPQKEDEMVSTDKLTAALLKDENPAVYEEVRGAAFSEGVARERERISFINSKSKGVDPELVAKAISEGWDTEKTLSAFFDYVSERKEARIEQLREHHGEDKSHGVDDTESDDAPESFKEGGDDKPDAKKIADMPEGNDKWKAEWEASAQLREEHCDDYDAYLAYKRNPVSRRQKRHREAG